MPDRAGEADSQPLHDLERELEEFRLELPETSGREP
jgi:hypothetical protein